MDDLQWADPPSLQLLRHVVGSDQPLPVVVVGTFRDSEVGSEHPLADVLAWLHRQAGVTRIALRGLGDVELLTLLAGGAENVVDADGLAFRDDGGVDHGLHAHEPVEIGDQLVVARKQVRCQLVLDRVRVPQHVLSRPVGACHRRVVLQAHRNDQSVCGGSGTLNDRPSARCPFRDCLGREIVGALVQGAVEALPIIGGQVD